MWKKLKVWIIFEISFKQNMDNRKKLLFLIYLKNYTRRKNSFRRRKFLNILHVLQTFDSSILQIKTNLNILFLIHLTYANTKRWYWMMIYNQNWFERMWSLREDLLFKDLLKSLKSLISSKSGTSIFGKYERICWQNCW